MRFAQRALDETTPSHVSRRWRTHTRRGVVLTGFVAFALGATAMVAAASSREDGSASTGSALTGPAEISPAPALVSVLAPNPAAPSGIVLVPSVSGALPSHAAAPQTPAYDTQDSPCSAMASACVDIAAKKAWLQDSSGVTFGPVPIETGQAGHETPTGTFHVSWKALYTVSTIYGIPMPHAVFFAAGGIAFHEGPLDVPSHGCVHLAAADAIAFFDALKPGNEVDVW